MQFKLTTAFILIGTVLAIVHAAPTSDATWHSDPAVNAGPDIDFVYPPRAVPEATDTEAANPDIIFSYPPRAVPEATDTEAANPDIIFSYPPRTVPETTDTETANPDIIFSYPPRAVPEATERCLDCET